MEGPPAFLYDRRMKARFGILFAIASLLGPAYAGADSLPDCPVPEGADLVTHLGSVPKPIHDRLVQSGQRMADAGEDFNSTDVMVPGVSNERFMFAWHSADKWLVAVERGGIAYYQQILVFHADESSAVMGANTPVPPNKLCEVAQQQFDLP